MENTFIPRPVNAPNNEKEYLSTKERTIRYLILTVFIFIMTSCATIPQNPEFKVQAGDSVGVFIDIPDNLIHTFIGTTIFNNSVKNYPYNWELESYAKKKIIESLVSADYKVIDLKKTSISYKDLKDMIIVKNKQWTVNPKSKDAYDTLKKLGIKSIVYFKSAKTVAYVQCNMYNCTDFTTDSYGLFTRSFLGIKSNSAVAAFDHGIIITDPLALTNFTSPKAIVLKKFRPDDFKNITKIEWQPVKNEITNYIDSFTAQLQTLLSNETSVKQ